jgi:putative ABC transport system permease protein
MSVWLLAGRNLLRNRRRSVATLLALAIGATSILLFGGFRNNIDYAMLTGYVRTGGHLQIQHRDFFLYGNGNPVAYAISNYEQLIQQIRVDPDLSARIAVITPTLIFGGIAGNYDKQVSRTIFGTGLVPADMTQMRTWDEYSVDNPSPAFALDQAGGSGGAILGVGVARVLLLCSALGVKNCPEPPTQDLPGSGKSLPADVAALADLVDDAKPAAAADVSTNIELLVGQSRGAPNVTTVKVLSAENQGFKELDDVAVIVAFETARKLIYGRDKPKATALMLQLHHTEDVEAVIARLNEVLPGFDNAQPLTVLDFKTLNPFYVQTVDLFNMIFGFIFALIGGIVVFTVSNTMNTAVVERTVEIGTLRAIGVRQNGIRRLFVAEGLILGVAGALTGTVLALLISGIINLSGLTWLPPGSSETLKLTLRVMGENALIIGTNIGLIVIATVSAWWPAWRAADLKIVDSLRHA